MYRFHVSVRRSNDKTVKNKNTRITQHKVHLLIPVFFGDFVQTTKHDWQNFINILLNQTKNIFIIPEVQCPFCNLKKT